MTYFWKKSGSEKAQDIVQKSVRRHALTQDVVTPKHHNILGSRFTKETAHKRAVSAFNRVSLTVLPLFSRFMTTISWGIRAYLGM